MNRLAVLAFAASAVAAPAAAGASPPGAAAPGHLSIARPHTAGAASSCPPMPRAAPQGYRVVLKDNFWGTSINSKLWFRWEGQPGGDPYGWWSTGTHLTAFGSLWLMGRWVTTGGNPAWSGGGEVTTGIGSRHAQVYGMYQWCMRTTNMPGTETDVLLWPANYRHWPPEIDLFECGGDPSSYTLTLHYGTPQQNYVTQETVTGQDATKWNVYTALWRPGEVQLRENGAVVATIAFDVNVPVIPMRLDFQTQAITAHPTIGSTAVDWVVEYAPRT